MRVTSCISRFPYFCKSVENPLSVIGSDEVTGSTPVISLAEKPLNKRLLLFYIILSVNQSLLKIAFQNIS